MNDNMTNVYDNMTMTISHDIMTDIESEGSTSKCIISTKQSIYFYNVNTTRIG